MDRLILEAALAGRRCGPALFAIQHKASQKRLIVATRNLSKRLSSYCSEMRKFRSHNSALLADLRDSGIDGFELHLLQLVDNPRDLLPMKRMLIEQDRAAGRTYHPLDAQQRRLIVEETALKASKELNEALARIEGWLDAEYRRRR